MKNILFIFLFVYSFTSVFGQQNLEFQSAEEKIVYNKSNGLNKYDGVAVEYTYQVLDNKNLEEDEIIELANTYFNNILDTDYYSVDGKVYISILTDGSLSNHEGSFKLRDGLYKRFIFYKRRYHLK